ncbi:MAG: hypothetical protein Q7U60_03535, partial [Candidatus Methanoperedens sp.]|nr:hypothetical protein [Candidatus Methanoperedens sp.]
MSCFDDAKALVDHSKETFKRITEIYNQSLKEKEIKSTLLIEIKNFMENLRSALDYTAHGVFDKYGSSYKGDPKIYFPYASISESMNDFRNKKRIEYCIPGIEKRRPDILTKIESYQHFSDKNNKWLPLFMDLNNENKHQKLTPQNRKEYKE